MNERILELAEQARKKPMGDSWCYTNPQEFEKKFAELIVRDCVDIVKWTPSMFPSDAIIKNIKEHFGVE